jgi:hypothetical protein
MAYAQTEDALTLARALANDTAGVVFTDGLLMPLLNSAHRGLQREPAENGVSVLVEQQDIELDVNSSTGVTNTELSDVSSPQFPTDCWMPYVLWERVAANAGDVFVPMEKFTSSRAMLNLQPSSFLQLWEWREDKINLIGATQSITVRVRYDWFARHRANRYRRTDQSLHTTGADQRPPAKALRLRSTHNLFVRKVYFSAATISVHV